MLLKYAIKVHKYALNVYKDPLNEQRMIRSESKEKMHIQNQNSNVKPVSPTRYNVGRTSAAVKGLYDLEDFNSEKNSPEFMLF